MRVQDALRSLEATFEVVDIDPDLADTAAFCAHYGYPPDASANAILVASKRPPGRFALCVVLATTRLDVNHRVKELMDVKKLSFASGEVTQLQTGMMIGGVTPFDISTEIPIYVDQRVMDPQMVIVGGGNRATKILVDPEVFLRMPGVSVTPDLANPMPRPAAESE